MALDAWLPIGFRLPDGAESRLALFEGPGWQVVGTTGGGRALLADESLAQRWLAAGLMEDGALARFSYGQRRLLSISSTASQVLCPVADGRSPDTKSEALAFALALRATRAADADAPLQDAIYVERISRLLPTYSISARTDDDVVLGHWLTGGAHVSCRSFRRLRQAMSWLGDRHLREVVRAAGFVVTESIDEERPGPTVDDEAGGASLKPVQDPEDVGAATKPFELPGREDLAAFFNEHVVDIVQNRERYRSLGISFPSAVVLHGPPGCGKTFAVERLVDFLGWPSFQIDASSVASPYIHETSKKVAQVFEAAIESAPSVVVIDEMEAFLADREMGSGHHRVEELAEFLRRIPEAAKREVLIIGMTNRIEMIDPAILRRGRFDHVVKVDFATHGEVSALLEKLLSVLPREGDVDVAPLARELSGRPLSDVAFVVREGARLAARSGRNRLDRSSLEEALRAAPGREREGGTDRRIGFL